MKTDNSISLDPEYNWPPQVLERINVNLSGVRVGSSWIQGFEWPITEQPHLKRPAPVGKHLYSSSDEFRLLLIPFFGPNLITCRFPAPRQSDPNAHLSESLAWMGFTREALKDSRPMTEWERKAAADFFWSEFD
jgi:hypothetical protein